MKVSCGVNGEPWTVENPLYLCHHCGMPVCLRHGRIIGSDDAFGAPEKLEYRAAIEKVDYRAAMHCPTCVRDHPGGRRAYSGSSIDQRMCGMRRIGRTRNGTPPRRRPGPRASLREIH